MSNIRAVLRLIDEIDMLKGYVDDHADTITHAEVIAIHDALVAVWPKTSRRKP